MLCFPKNSGFQCYNDFCLEHDRFDKLSELLKVVGVFRFFFSLHFLGGILLLFVLFCHCYLGF